MSRLSVIIPARNAERFLAPALDSVFAQGLDDPEVIVVDDGSTDATLQVASRYGHGVRAVSQPASGSGAARNLGLAGTTGDLVAFLDADDLWTPDKSAAQLPLLHDDPGLGLVFSDMISFQDGAPDQEGLSYFRQRGFDGACTLSSIFLYDMISTPTVIVRRACLRKAGGFDATLPIGQDTDLWFRIGRDARFAAVDRPLVRRRLHGSNTTRDGRLLARCVEEIWGRHLDLCLQREPHMRRRLLAHFEEIRWNHRFVEGCSMLKDGRRGEARRLLAEAIEIMPLRPRAYAFWLASLLRRGPEGPSAGSA